MYQEQPATYARVRCRLSPEGILDAVRQGEVVGTDYAYIVEPGDPDWDRIFRLNPETIWRDADEHQPAVAVGVELAIGRARSARLRHITPESVDLFAFDDVLCWRRPSIEISRGSEPATFDSYLSVDGLIEVEEEAEVALQSEIDALEGRRVELEEEWIAWSHDDGRAQASQLVNRLTATGRDKFPTKTRNAAESAIRTLSACIAEAEPNVRWAERLHSTMLAQFTTVEDAEAEDRRIHQREADLLAASLWVGDNGSPRLRKAAAAGVLNLSMGVYRDERLAKERPGWTWWESKDGVKAGINPTEQQLDALVEARKLDLDARLVWTQKGMAILAPFLGRQIVLDVEPDSGYGFDEEPF